MRYLRALLAVAVLLCVCRAGAIAACATDAYSTYVLSLAPTAYYRFDETSGPTLTDCSGNGHNGTYGSSITYSTVSQIGWTGITDTAIYDTGAGGGTYGYIPPGSSTIPIPALPHNNVTDAWSVVMWLLPNHAGGNNYGAFMWGGGGLSYVLTFGAYPANFYLVNRGSTSLYSAGISVPAAFGTMIALTHAAGSSSITAYEGNTSGSGKSPLHSTILPVSDTAMGNSATGYIGASPFGVVSGSQQYAGPFATFDDTAFFQAALSYNQVYHLYTSADPIPTASSPIGSWRTRNGRVRF